MNKTPNYNLNQWEPTDQVRRVDFNTDNAKIDRAIRAVDDKAEALSGSKAEQSALEAEVVARQAADRAIHDTLSTHAQSITKLGNCQIYRIPYTGVGEGATQRITVPERPVLVLLIQSGGPIAVCVYGAEQSRSLGTSDSNSFWISWSGNSLSWTNYTMNMSGASYIAIAFCGRS